MERSKAESFTAYLEARQKERAAPPVPATGGTSFGLLAALASAAAMGHGAGRVAAGQRHELCGLSQSIKRLEDTGYLTIGGQPGSETAQLTKLGSQVADLARAS